MSHSITIQSRRRIRRQEASLNLHSPTSPRHQRRRKSDIRRTWGFNGDLIGRKFIKQSPEKASLLTPLVPARRSPPLTHQSPSDFAPFADTYFIKHYHSPIDKERETTPDLFSGLVPVGGKKNSASDIRDAETLLLTCGCRSHTNSRGILPSLLCTAQSSSHT